MAMQKIRGPVEWIDDLDRPRARCGVRVPVVAFLRYDRVVRMALMDDGDAGLLRGEVRRRHIVGSAFFSGVGDPHRGGLFPVHGRGRVGSSSGRVERAVQGTQPSSAELRRFVIARG